AYYGAAQKMNSTIVEYINGMEVVKVFNRDGDSYKRFETDVKNYRDFTLDWYWVCWPWMALYNSIIPCTAMFTLPLGAWFVLRGWSTL
ncbi:ABC transporter ATP-binding protein, partial [Klebsiella oxytoca]